MVKPINPRKRKNILAVKKTDRSVSCDAHSRIRKFAALRLRLLRYSQTKTENLFVREYKKDCRSFFYFLLRQFFSFIVSISILPVLIFLLMFLPISAVSPILLHLMKSVFWFLLHFFQQQQAYLILHLQSHIVHTS